MSKPQIEKTPNSDIVHLNVPVPKSVRRDVKALAAKEDKTIAQIVAEILASGVAQRMASGAGQ